MNGFYTTKEIIEVMGLLGIIETLAVQAISNKDIRKQVIEKMEKVRKILRG